MLEPQIQTLLILATDYLTLRDPDRAAACLREVEGPVIDAEYARVRYMNRFHWVRGRLHVEAGEVTVETLTFTHSVVDADQVWDGIVGGTVRTAALIVRQPTAVRHRVRAAFTAILESYRRGATLEVPVAVKLAAGIAPARRRVGG
jgi:hypothetical protein